MKAFRVILLCALALLIATPIWAQDEGLKLSLSRDFGYGGFSGDIEGTFSFRASGPDSLREVRFYIDDQLVGSDTEPPWRYQFHTGDFPLGVHRLVAVGMTVDGAELRSNEIIREFVPASKSWDFIAKVVIPLILITLAVPAVMVILDRRRGGGQRKGSYGLAGGAVCPKCGYPFSRHIWAPNMGVAKFDRCPHCGKWSMVRRATPSELKAAEEAFFGEPEEAAEDALTPEEKLRRQLEESRFD